MNRLSRRMCLRGLGGATLGLPFLESLSGAAVAPPRRIAFLWQNNGVDIRTFWPATGYGPLTAASFEGRGIAPLAPHASRLLIPRGLDMSGGAFGHLGSLGLTGAEPGDFSTLAKMKTAWPRGGSLDRFIAERTNPGGRGPLNLRVGQPNDGQIFGCVSYRAPAVAGAFGTPVFPQLNPAIAYRDLMNLGAESTPDLIARRKSVIDIVDRRVQTLNQRVLSQADHQKLDMHLTAVRDLEKSLSNAACQGLPAKDDAAVKAATAANFALNARYHLDIMALAFACDTNRVATLQFGIEAGGPAYRFDGLDHRADHHTLSHADTNGDPRPYQDLLAEIDRWHATKVAYFISRLSSYAEGTGSLLDNTLIVWMNSQTDGNAHNSRDMPVVLAGNVGRYFKSGQYLDVRDSGGARKPHNMLLTTFANAVGITETHYGPKGKGRPGQLDPLRA